MERPEPQPELVTIPVEEQQTEYDLALEHNKRVGYIDSVYDATINPERPRYH